jgi:hypothetical protein
MSAKAISSDSGISQEERERIRAEKRAEIAAKVQKVREEKARMSQIITMFEQAINDDIKDIYRIPQKVPKGAKGAILSTFRNLLKKYWKSTEDEMEKNTSFHMFCSEFGQTFMEFQSEFAEGPRPWQNLVGCWDFQPTHLFAIKKWYDTLPKDTVLLDPCSGKGMLAACLKVFDIPVVCNDIQKQESPFIPDISNMDGIEFLESYYDENPETPIVIILSWAPQKGQQGADISERIFRFAHLMINVLGVIHISEGWMKDRMIGCTDTVEALVFKEANFETIVDLPREYRQQWEQNCDMPIDDHLTINIPMRD